MREKEKGFTLVEVLAVIVILGIVMLIAVPSISKYMDVSRKKSYVSSARSYIKSVKTKVGALKYKFNDEYAVYYLPINCIDMEKSGNSPYGDWVEAYVLVTVEGIDYSYFWTSYDDAGNGIIFASEEELDTGIIESGVTSIDKNATINDRSFPIIMNSSTCLFD